MRFGFSNFSSKTAKERKSKCQKYIFFSSNLFRIMMISDANMTPAKLVSYYGNIADQIGDVSHMPLNFNLISDFPSQDDFDAKAVRKTKYPMSQQVLDKN